MYVNARLQESSRHIPTDSTRAGKVEVTWRDYSYSDTALIVFGENIHMDDVCKQARFKTGDTALCPKKGICYRWNNQRASHSLRD